MKKKVLVTGGSGTIGKNLIALLQAWDYEVAILSRKLTAEGAVKTYLWNVAEKYVDPNAIADNDIIIHLAGAGVFDKPWTPAYKKEILESRIVSTQLLHDAIVKSNKKLDCFVSASAIGLYGTATTEHWFEEQDPAAPSFLSDVVVQWENAVNKIANLGTRTVKVRIGIVLSKTGGALEQLAAPVKFFAGAPLSTGQQWTPWIHIDDLCGIFLHAIKTETMTGEYNAASPHPVTNQQLTKEIATVLHKPLLLPNVPAFVMNLILGKEKAAFLLGGSRVSPKKILATGYKFRFERIEDALKDLL